MPNSTTMLLVTEIEHLEIGCFIYKKKSRNVLREKLDRTKGLEGKKNL